MNKNISAGIFLLALMSFTSVQAANNYSYQPTQIQPVYNSMYNQAPLQYPQNNMLRGNVVMVPAGATMTAMLTAPISSEFTSVGQPISMALGSDFYYGDKLIAPAGSTVFGTVIDSSKAKRGGINGKLCIRFTQINTPYGTQIPISAVIKTEDSSGILIGGTKMDVAKEYAKDMAVGSASGAISGLVFGALAGGEVGRGAALGTAVGAGGGLVKSVIDKGNEVYIPANASIDLMFTQPVTVSTSSYQYEN